MVRVRFASFVAKTCAALAFVLTAACAPVLAPPGVGEDKRALTQPYFLARDGEKLPLRIWGPDHPEAVIVALHGMSDYSNAFTPVGEWLADHGITTLAY